MKLSLLVILLGMFDVALSLSKEEKAKRKILCKHCWICDEESCRAFVTLYDTIYDEMKKKYNMRFSPFKTKEECVKVCNKEA
ncbi:unnamed protein product [Cylicocyclus nassatus]|uniref:Uncharacterized protein n=1 Tax=Cylicocyclus nassatus TaxID=53992 RepID=A0AA36GVN6_CYLNA|nr:unnamed protein product [Cylicocyclus nassatus]